MTDTVTERGEGSCRERNGVVYITYRAGGTLVMIKAEKTRVTVRRKGDTSSEMSYEEGKHTSFAYRTPYGTIDMNVFTKRISVNIIKGEIGLSYELEAGGDKLYNSMTIKMEKGRL